MKVSNEVKEDLNIDGRVVKGCKSFKYLGVILTSNAKSLDINNKIGQGKRAIKQLNSVLWNVELTRNTKKKKQYTTQSWKVLQPMVPRRGKLIRGNLKDCLRWKWISGDGAA